MLCPFLTRGANWCRLLFLHPGLLLLPPHHRLLSILTHMECQGSSLLTCTHMHKCMHPHKHTHTHKHMHTHTHTHTHRHTHTQTHTYTDTHTHRHTHTHTHVHMHPSICSNRTYSFFPTVSLQIVKEYERAVILRLGRLTSRKAKGPGNCAVSRHVAPGHVQ